MRYKQKVDWWITMIMVGTVVMYFPLIPFVPADEQYILWISVVVTAVIVLPFLYGYVELQEDRFIVRVGAFKQTVYYENITSVRLVNNFLSSMAMTSKRIEIVQANKSVFTRKTYIGPLDREDVYYELLRRCRNLEQ